MSNEENWLLILKNVKKYINENKKRPSSKDKNNEIKSLGNWINAQRQNYNVKIQLMKENSMRLEWEKFILDYKQYFVSNEEEWFSTLEKVKKYINENGKRPSCKDTNNEINSLGSWINVQQQNYNIKVQIMKEDNVRSEWEKFILDYKQYFMSNEEEWLLTLGKVKKYIDDNKKRPLNNNDSNEIKTLGRWIDVQQRNYNKQLQIMKKDKIKLEWDKFISEYKYYFVSKDEQWLLTMEKVKKYIDDNKKRPSYSNKNNEIKSLGSWISVQLQNYDKKVQIMKEDNIRKEWTNFTTSEKYKTYF